MNSLRHAKALLIEDNPHLFGGIHPSTEIPAWLSCVENRDNVFIPHFYAPYSSVRAYFIEKGHMVIDMSRAAVRIHIEKLLEEAEKVLHLPEEIVCINAEWGHSEACTKRIYRYQSDELPCIPPLPPYQEFVYRSIPFSEDDLFRHISTLYDLREEMAFHRLFLHLLDNNGLPFNYRKTAETLDIRFETLKTFLKYLERAFLVRILEEGNGPKARRISLITDWRLVNHLLKKNRMELFLEGIGKESLMSYRFLQSISGGKEPSLREVEGG